MPDKPTIGRTLPQNTNVPRVQRKMPAPFSRPSISISGGADTPKREWRRVLACNVEPGDVLSGFGRVDEVDDVLVDVGVWQTVVIRNGDSDYPETRTFSATDTVFAFTTSPTTA